MVQFWCVRSPGHPQLSYISEATIAREQGTYINFGKTCEIHHPGEKSFTARLDVWLETLCLLQVSPNYMHDILKGLISILTNEHQMFFYCSCILYATIYSIYPTFQAHVKV